MKKITAKEGKGALQNEYNIVGRQQCGVLPITPLGRPLTHLCMDPTTTIEKKEVNADVNV